MNIKNIYFPPCGFGFWYLLGVLNSQNYNDYNLYGSSAGSLICLVSLLNKNDRNLNTILNLCIDIQKKKLCASRVFRSLYLFVTSELLFRLSYRSKYVVILGLEPRTPELLARCSTD